MSRSEAYATARATASSNRSQYNITGPCVMLNDLRRIYRDQGISIIYWPQKLRVLRGAYIIDDFGPTVMVAKKLPNDPKIFTLAHELKHHLLDRGVCSTTEINESSEEREIAAEVFAAELLLPEELFLGELLSRGLVPEDGSALDVVKHQIVSLKRETRTTLSYQGLSKRAERLGFVRHGGLVGVRWKKLEESLYGIPFYVKGRK